MADADASTDTVFIGSDDGCGEDEPADDMPSTQPCAEDMGATPASTHQRAQPIAGAGTPPTQPNKQYGHMQPHEPEHSPTDQKVADALTLAESLIASNDIHGAARPAPFRAAKRAADPYPQVTVVEDIP